jgi:hypothetical protein
MADDGLHSMEFRIQVDIGSRHDKQESRFNIEHSIR